MQIVIEIPDNTYNLITKGDENRDFVYKSDLMHVIENGVILPKGHGKIVDIDKLIDNRCNECGHIRGVSCTIPCYVVLRMLDAPILIEADKTESEG